MTLSEAADKVKNLRIDFSKEYTLEAEAGLDTIQIYKTIPAKFIVSVDAFKRNGVKCRALELTPHRKKFIRK